MPSTARVDFAGRSQVLNLMSEGSAMAYRNGTFGWSSQGKASSLKNLRSGALALTDCVAFGEQKNRQAGGCWQTPIASCKPVVPFGLPGHAFSRFPRVG